MGAMIVARDLVKRYGELTAVDGISFTVEAGECFGFLGPNGAGKTTTIRMITCVSPVTDGSLMVDGMHVQVNPRQIKSVLGVVPQDDNLDPELSVRQNLRAYARYFGLSGRAAEERIDEALELMSLTERQKEKIDALSGGLKRRLTIARGLLNTPRILVLDEPTTGLDPAARHLVWQRLRLLRSQGVTMLLTTHYMEEAAQLCDRVVVIDHGKIIAEGTPQDLVREHAGQDVIEVHATPDERPEVMAQLASLHGVTIEEVEDIVYVYLRGDNGIDPAALEVGAEKLVHRRANLEDVFLRLTGRGLEE
ncbi:MAG TPA: ABC transporter ATP-binding protein [Dehalococcoidia bacterium]|nr:ABC transporter ATP-binding protein [Dehalococcoidia bacterium]